MFVIRFNDIGMYNAGNGYEVPLRDADRYHTREEAKMWLEHLSDGEIIELTDEYLVPTNDLVRRTKVETEKLLLLLNDPHPGLSTWSTALHAQFRSLAALFEVPQNDHTGTRDQSK